MKILDISQPTSNILTEANILNVKDPHDGHSIQKYLAKYAKAIGSDIAKKMFTKKLQKLLLNNPKYHFAVRDLPSNAPEWAEQAMAQRDLFFFKPDPQLDNMIEHLTHYIAKMEEDMDGDNANFKAIATKEFAGFPKVESLEVLEQKSNKYFEQTTSATSGGTDIPGTKPIYKSGEFTWLKLESAEAFKYAGNTLQNCIGSHWTKAKCNKAGESIIVLADTKGALIVAARIDNKSNELREMKGKNNRAPIDAYMPPVAAMINKFKLSVGPGAHLDVINAGYYFDDTTKTLLTKPQAIKKLVSYDVIGKLPSGLKVVQPKPAHDNEASKMIFSELYMGNLYGSDRKGDVFEARRADGNPTIIAIIYHGELRKLHTYFNERLHDESHLNEAVENSKNREHTKEFISELLSRHKIDKIDIKISRLLFWEYNLELDKDNNRLVNRATGEDHQTSKKDHKWIKYVDRSTIKGITNTFDDEDLPGIAEPIEKVFIAREEQATDRSRNKHDIHLMVVVDSKNEGHLVNISGSVLDDTNVGYKKEIDDRGWRSIIKRVSVDGKSIRSIVALAKSENFKLRTPAKARFGITGEDPEQYKQHDTVWKKIPGDPEAIKADFSHLRDKDRFIAVYATASTELGGSDTAQDPLGINEKMYGSDYNHYNAGAHSINTSTHFSNHTEETAYAAIGKVDAIYKINIGYGTASAKHGVMVLVSNKTITKIDKATENHTWQGWDDFDDVVKILNKFATDHKLKFATDAVTTNKRARTEFRVVDGKLTTMQNVKKSELSRQRKKEGVDSLEYADGWVLQRLTPDEQSKWIRRGVKSGVRGQAWLLKTDEGKKAAVVTIVHQRVARLFSNTDPGDEWPSYSNRIVAKYNRYVKTAMDHFKWKPNKTGLMKASPIDKSIIDTLKHFNNQTSPTDYNLAPDSHNSFHLKALGALKKPSGGNFRDLEITEEGERMLKVWEDIKKKDPTAKVTNWDLTQGNEPHADFKLPESKPKQSKGASAARPSRTRAGGTTKASQALDKFTSHVEEHGQIPTRGQFIAYMEEDPFNMTKSGAQTYYYTTKKKYANLNESILGGLAGLLLVEPDATYTSFADMVID